MDYSFVRNITIYCAAGNIGDTLNESGWRGNPIWRGALYFPHYHASLVDFLASGNSQVYLSRAGNWDVVKRHIPSFDAANGVFNTHGQSSLYSRSYSGYFPGMTGISPGLADMPLHIVTCQGETAAYIYQTPIAGDSGAVYAEIQNNGDIVMNGNIKLALPRFAATSSYAYLHGCLLDDGVTEENNIVSSAIDFHVNAAWRDPDLSGLHIAFFNRDSSAIANTIAFLNRWPLNGKSRFDASGFLKGVIVGRRLRGGNDHIVGQSGGDPGDPVNINHTGEADGAENRAVYHEKSFLSGLSAGLAF